MLKTYLGHGFIPQPLECPVPEPPSHIASSGPSGVRHTPASFHHFWPDILRIGSSEDVEGATALGPDGIRTKKRKQ